MIFDFFRFKLGPLRNMRRKNPSRFPIPVKVGFALSFVQIVKREGFFRRIFTISQGTPAFLKITFQLHRNPTVLHVVLSKVHYLCMYVDVMSLSYVYSTCKIIHTCICNMYV